MGEPSIRYRNYRFPPHSIARGLAIFPVPFEPGPVEEMLLERGVVVSYETSRRWGKFGPTDAKQNIWTK
ncbi:hypothetical protein AJ87_17005 [Rhizobium yanglingense]|nr:hypothetical protein AJ87_17005 [Rhizobium yanglingense]